jgi:hypothetical protein
MRTRCPTVTALDPRMFKAIDSRSRASRLLPLSSSRSLSFDGEWL